MEVHHVGVEARQVKDELREPTQSQLDRQLETGIK